MKPDDFIDSEASGKEFVISEHDVVSILFACELGRIEGLVGSGGNASVDPSACLLTS